MLIGEAIEAAKAAGLLHPAAPVEPWAPRPRAFLMCQPLREEIDQGKEDLDEKVRARWAALEGAISTFIVGGYITDKMVKQLQPPKFEHWELISGAPKPSLRVFVRFLFRIFGSTQCSAPTICFISKQKTSDKFYLVFKLLIPRLL